MDLKEEALKLHKENKGKLATTSKVEVKTKEDLSLVYTPGVAEVCKEIAANPKSVYDYTMKANSVAVVTDGSAVLGLGNLGAEASLPVMEGKAILLTSHILSEVDEVSSRVSLIHNGKIEVTGTPDDLKNSVGAREFIELSMDNLPAETRRRIEALDIVTAVNEKEGGWISFGVDDLFDGTQAIIEIMKNDNVKTGFRQHSITLEDAFIHKVGQLSEAFDH
ncbi:MAG: hypothetical protein IH840_02830 [Candidatus Heimdallarchaeota archaeon]|nr:hypothetical protein [Candidatus Heimdallarchaeota archaeon]